MNDKTHKWNRWLLLVLLCGLCVPAIAQDDHEVSTLGTDFWMMMPINGGDQRPETIKLVAVGDTACTISVSNPSAGWSTTAQLPANGKVEIPLLNATSSAYTIGGTVGKAFHVVSTAEIQLFAVDSQLASCGISCILPTPALRSRYMVQTYPGDPARAGKGAEVGFVAVHDSTQITMVQPCNVEGNDAGTRVTLNLMQGQSVLRVAPPSNTFSGMVVEANKPFALFQGTKAAAIPAGAPSVDFVFEQAVPLEFWGTEFVLVSNALFTAGSQVLITSSADNCVITFSSGMPSITLNEGQTYEFNFSYNLASHIQSTAPICIGVYHHSSDYYGPIGDASQVMIPPIANGVGHAKFFVHGTSRVQDHFVNIVTDAASVGGMRLNGNDISSQFSSMGNYRYARVRVYNSSGAHTLHNDNGTFVAWVYGIGQCEDYAFVAGMRFGTMLSDTILLTDTVCQGQSYNDNGFSIGANETAMPGDLVRTRSDYGVDMQHVYQLTLTVLPVQYTSFDTSMCQGDTLYVGSSPVTAEGSRRFRLTGANGCDSIVVVNVSWRKPALEAIPDTICPGQTAVLTASCLDAPSWSSTPNDPSLDTCQGQNPIAVSPAATTVYYLLDAAGVAIDSVTLFVAPLPTPCITVDLDSLDAGNPICPFYNCTPGRTRTLWTFSDGITETGETVEHEFQLPLGDSVWAILTTCNTFLCCADTTVHIPVSYNRQRELWFPNVFTPGLATNSLFLPASVGIITYELSIFNRWGDCLFHTTDLREGWDGTYRGHICPQGTYVYICHYGTPDFPRRTLFGSVTLLR